MNKYQVYLTSEDTIYIEADDFIMYREAGLVHFVKGGYNNNNVIAVFVISNICGFEQVDEFDG